MMEIDRWIARLNDSTVPIDEEEMVIMTMKINLFFLDNRWIEHDDKR